MLPPPSTPPADPAQQNSPYPVARRGLNSVLFRGKWIILGFVAVLVAVGILQFALPKRYESEAKLLVRYVIDTRSMAPGEKIPPVIHPEPSGESIMNTEVEILTSFDLATEVADLVGPEKILAKAGGGTNRLNAAAFIANPKNLIVEVPKNGSIIRVQFRHPDASIVEPVLTRLIDCYVQKQLAIHRGVGVMDEFITQQMDRLRSDIAATEAELWKLKTNAGVISVEDSQKALSDLIAKIQEALLTAEEELAERLASSEKLEKLQPATTSADSGSSANKINEDSHSKVLDARVKVLAGQLSKLRAQAALLDQAATEILKLQRKKELDEASYHDCLALREQARIAIALGPGHSTNISVVQSPTPAHLGPGFLSRLLR